MPPHHSAQRKQWGRLITFRGALRKPRTCPSLDGILSLLPGVGGQLLGRLVVVSNRVSVPGDSAQRAGGLEVALRPALEKNGGVWLGWSGKVAAGNELETRSVQHKNIQYVV